MAQTGFTPIVTYNTATATTVPSAANLAQGELAVNVTDKKLYTKDSGGNVILLASSGGDVTGPASSTNLAIPTFSGTGGKTLLDNAGATISAGVITATGFSGPLTGNASTVTTNANLTGPITSVGNATSIASQTGTGTKFVVDTSPTLVTPTATTTIGVGAATPSASGAGITFPATQSASTDANTLDDYEEGDVTLGATTTLAPGGGTITINTGTSFIKYTKIGRQVTVAGLLEVTSVSSPTGNISINGMPFQAGTDCYSSVSIYAYGWEATMTTTAIGSMSPASTSLSIQKTNALGSVAAMAADVKAGTTIYFSVTYFV